ncbi:MAG: hypothetical protein PHH44_05105 [bacterium]|nr:hypothetical protein [bacterium]
MKRCVKCIMPDTAKGIKLDEKGLCQLCRDFKPYVPKGEQKLRADIKDFIDPKAEYNCIVPVSGGRDSSYALYYVKEVLGLKPLAVHNDNDFETEVATNNLNVITKTLNIPLLRIQSANHITKTIVAEKFKMNAPFGPGLVVEQTCEACKYGFESASYNTARKKGIKVIFWGDSVDESTTPYHSLYKHYLPSKWKRLFSPNALSLFKYKKYYNQMKQEYGPCSPAGLKEIHLFDYILWDQRVIVDVIQNKMGWSVPKDSATTWRTDCSIVPVVNYLTEKACGVSKLEIGFSNMVRSGKMDRDEALKAVEQVKNNTDVEKIKDFLRQMSISNKDINRVV